MRSPMDSSHECRLRGGRGSDRRYDPGAGRCSMIARPYWITTQLAIIPRPRGGDWLDDEMMALREAGIDVVVSMLEKDEALELGLEREAISAEGASIRFINFPVLDRSTPFEVSAFEALMNTLEALLASGKRVGVHCRACIGRASVTVASLLIRS